MTLDQIGSISGSGMDDVSRPEAGEVKCGLFIDWHASRSLPIIADHWRKMPTRILMIQDVWEVVRSLTRDWFQLRIMWTAVDRIWSWLEISYWLRHYGWHRDTQQDYHNRLCSRERVMSSKSSHSSFHIYHTQFNYPIEVRQNIRNLTRTAETKLQW